MFKHITKAKMIEAVEAAPDFDWASPFKCIAGIACRMIGDDVEGVSWIPIFKHAQEALNLEHSVADKLLGPSENLQRFDGTRYFKSVGECATSTEYWDQYLNKDLAIEALNQFLPEPTVTPEQLIAAIQADPKNLYMALWSHCIAGYTLRAAGIKDITDPDTDEFSFQMPSGVVVTGDVTLYRILAAHQLGIPVDTELFEDGQWPTELFNSHASSAERAIAAIRDYFLID